MKLIDKISLVSIILISLAFLFLWVTDLKAQVEEKDCDFVCRIYKDLGEETGAEYHWTGHNWVLKNK